MNTPTHIHHINFIVKDLEAQVKRRLLSNREFHNHFIYCEVVSGFAVDFGDDAFLLGP